MSSDKRNFYGQLLEENRKAGTTYSDEAIACIESTVENLLAESTTAERPGMLLGMIQSGKTKTFLGVIALALDKGFDICVVFTKGTVALATQTYQRLAQTFETAIEYDELRVFDIMNMPKLVPNERRLPLIIVAKKEDDNLNRLQKTLLETYPEFADRRVLIVDDEADFASVGFSKSKAEGIRINKIMRQIDELRKSLPLHSFLQVTATPYSLYLQPSDMVNYDLQEVYRPVRPAFTELVPVHGAYIGGKFYFEDSRQEGSIASFIYREVDTKEIDRLHHKDGRSFKPSEALTSNSVSMLRKAIVSFAVGGSIRRLQAQHNRDKPSKYSFIIHTEQSKKAHEWQEEVIESIVRSLQDACETSDPIYHDLVQEAYDNLAQSVVAGAYWLPSLNEVLAELAYGLGAIQIEKVNSEKAVKDMLDKDGQLNLRNRLNIFIGGQILDRGLTIRNLIGFYYGRRPKKFQQDTVLQHARMYGARPMEDLAVTRFYTSPEIHAVMANIHEFDSALRAAFERGGQESGVVFIQRDSTQIVPCAPNKVMLSTLTTLTPFKRLLPVGFQSGYKTHISKVVEEIDALTARWQGSNKEDEPFEVPIEDALHIVELISKTLEFEDVGYDWDVKAFKASMEYVSGRAVSPTQRGKILLLPRRDRGASRRKGDGSFERGPDASNIEGAIARRHAIDIPILMLFRQNGKKDNGWRDCPFWWPVLQMPRNVGTVVFASDVYESDEKELEGLF